MMTQVSVGQDETFSTNLDAIVTAGLSRLAAALDQDVESVVDSVLSALQQHLDLRLVCLFLCKADATTTLLRQCSDGSVADLDIARHQLAAQQTALAAANDRSSVRTILARLPNGATKMVLSYEFAQDMPRADTEMTSALTSLLPGIAGALRRSHVQGAATVRDRDAVANTLDQGIAVYDRQGDLKFINGPIQDFFREIPGILDNFSACIQNIKSWSSDAQFNQISNDTATNVEAILTLPSGLILKVQIRPLTSGAKMVICTDIGDLYSEKARWRAAIDGAGIGTWEWTIATGENRINDRWAEMLGYTMQELAPHVFDTFLNLLPAESVAVHRVACDKMLSGETERFECELQMYHKNGHRVWVLSRGRVTAYDANGKPAIISGMHLEISDLKLAEERLKQVVEGAQLGTWDWDIAAEVQRANHQWATMLGYTDDEVMPMTYNRWRDLVHPDDIDFVEESMGLCLSGQAEGMATEYRMRHKNGEWCWLLDRAKVISRTRDGRAAYIVGIQIEIGQQKAREEALLVAKTQAEQALNERNRAERRLADIAAVTDDWFWEQDHDLRFQFFSHTQFLRDVTGPRSQLLGRSWQEWLQNGKAEQVGADWATLFKTLADRAPFRDFVMELASDTDADPRWLRFSGTPVFDEGGNFIGYRGVGSDVTQLYLAKLRAEEANKSKTMFLANMSHEIRTPLNGVLGMAEVLDSSVTEPRHKEMIRTIRDSGESLLNILNDILDMSKIEARKLELELVPFDPTELATRIEELHRLRAEEKGLDFDISIGIGAERPRIGDPHRLRQVLNNLISNAIKFTDKGRVAVVMRGKLGRPLVIEISDTGIGMSAEQIEHIHEEFVQADSSIARRYGGTGLGMSITRTLVNMMGGRISIFSEVGSGTKISVELPLPNSEVEPTKEKPSTERQQHTAAGLHFLIADDNATNCTVLHHLLAQFGARTTIVENGLDALNAWRQTKFDLLLLDIAMPVMDGITAIQNIRAEEKTTGRSYTRAVAVTANVMPFQIAEYISAGFDASIGKPVSSKQLAQTIGALLDQNDPLRLANSSGQQLPPS